MAERAATSPSSADGFSAEEILAQMDAVGVHRAVIVPPTWVEDNFLFRVEQARVEKQTLGKSFCLTPSRAQRVFEEAKTLTLSGVAVPLTIILALCSFFEVKTGVPVLASARIATHSGRAADVSQVLSLHLYLSWFTQIFPSVIPVGCCYVAPESIHFGSWCLSRYPPEQRDRLLPMLRDLMGLLGVLAAAFFTILIYQHIHLALSQGPILPPDWISRGARLEMEGLVALVVVSAVIIHVYIGKFDEVARKD